VCAELRHPAVKAHGGPIFVEDVVRAHGLVMDLTETIRNSFPVFVERPNSRYLGFEELLKEKLVCEQPVKKIYVCYSSDQKKGFKTTDDQNQSF